MKIKTPIRIATALAVASSVLFGADVKPQTVLLRTYVSTNTIPGYIGGPEPTVGTNGWWNNMTLAVAISHPPRTVIATNYVLGYMDGTNTTELMTLVKQ